MTPEPEPTRLLTSLQAEAAVAARTAEVDRIVERAFETTLAPRFPQGIAVLAVGGFGRRELFPHSDIDVLLLTKDGIQGLKEPVGLFVKDCWDAALRLSHSVRTIAECSQLHEGNTELSISLIDRRFLTGDRELFEKLEEAMPKFFRTHSRTLARHLGKLTRSRHNKYQNTIYHLEPDIKETPGGMRDMHVVHWLSRLHPGDAIPDLTAARGFLFPLRHSLHERSKRDDNVLNFEAQDDVSSRPEEMMRSYYRHARAVHRAAVDLVEHSEERDSSLLGQFRDWRTRLSNSEFTVSKERLFVRSPQQLQSDPGLLLRVFTFAAKHGLRLARDTERRVVEALPALATAFPHPQWPPLKELFTLPQAAAALRAMEDTGALTALLPEWRNIECLVVRDFYHRYTVDEHTLVAIESLQHLKADRFGDLFSEIDQPWLLRIALLLHDIGKGHGDHVRIGLDMARKVTARFGMPPDEAETVLFLIEQHLILSSAMSSRDLSDVATARALAAKIGTVERLKLLTLLTFADISAVHPSAMSPWREEQLWRTYLLAHEELTRELETERIHAPEISSPELAGFLDGFPTRYLRTHSEPEIQQHLSLWRQAQTAGVAIDIARQSGFYRLVVAACDQPGLFASISGALASFGMNILKAEAFANSAHFILDTFNFSDPTRTLELNPSEADRLRDTILRVTLGKDDVRKLLKHRVRASKRPQRIQPSVTINEDASPAATLIEIVAEDRPGLLYALASAMSEAGCNIEVVLIDTEAQKALDVFYVTAGGVKLSPAQHGPLREALLECCSG